MTDALKAYVMKSLRGDAWIDFACAAATFLGGALVVLIAYYVTFGVASIVFFLSPWHVPNATFWARVAGVAFVVLAFVGSSRSRRKLFESYGDESDASGTALSTGLYLLGVGWGPRSLIPLSPATSRNSVKFAGDLAYSGPRLLSNAVRLLRRGRARATADFEGCARVLTMALNHPGRLPFEKVREAHPDLDLLEISEQLSWLRGVVLLRREPIGITLTDSLRDELEAALSRSV